MSMEVRAADLEWERKGFRPCSRPPDCRAGPKRGRVEVVAGGGEWVWWRGVRCPGAKRLWEAIWVRSGRG